MVSVVRDVALILFMYYPTPSFHGNAIHVSFHIMALLSSYPVLQFQSQ